VTHDREWQPAITIDFSVFGMKLIDLPFLLTAVPESMPGSKTLLGSHTTKAVISENGGVIKSTFFSGKMTEMQ
jgi:phage terminase large subunit-like protein